MLPHVSYVLALPRMISIFEKSVSFDARVHASNPARKGKTNWKERCVI